MSEMRTLVICCPMG